MANRPDTSPGFVLARRAGPVIVADYRERARASSCRRPISTPALTSALAVPLSDRGRTIGVLAVRSRAAKRFGDDEVRFLESLANLLATSLQRGAVGGGARTMRSGSRASASSPAASRTTSTTC